MISVAIITKNRLDNLQECLAALANQSVLPNEIIIIDGSQNQATRTAAKELLSQLRIPFQYIYEQKRGYSVARNRALAAATHPWIASIDDDCVAHKDWVKQIQIFTKRYPQAAAILGKSETTFPKNIFALTTKFRELQWKIPGMTENRVTDPEVMDLKNCALNRSFFAFHHIRFDQRPPHYAVWRHDDLDLGMQIWKRGGDVFFNKRMVVFHKDPSTIVEFLKQLWVDCMWDTAYRHKWKNYLKTTTNNRRSISRLFYVPMIKRKYGLSSTALVVLGFFLFVAKVTTWLARVYGWIKFHV